MKNNRTAFTMIELIFVIVILGILAAVAIPKLVATRNDAEVSKTSHMLMAGVSEIAAYAASKGEIDSNLSLMSNNIKNLADEGSAVLSANKAVVKMGNVNDCVTVLISSGTNEDNLSVTFGNASGDVRCKSLQKTINSTKYPMRLRGKYAKY